jgi:polyferredoxin
MARDRRPWRPFFGNGGKNGLDKAWRKVLKQLAFLLLSGVASLGVLAWFSGARETWTGGAGPVAYGIALVVALGLYVDLAWFREQFCNYLCPYARFQGALTDDHSLVIGYDAPRGEPRGKAAAQLLRARSAAADAPLAGAGTVDIGPDGKIRIGEEGVALTVGDCIDCGRCVAVCPQGIDIRDGYQLECVNCARCVDACTDVMGKLGHASLVSYTTVAASEGRKTRWVRPRNVGYAAALAAIAFLFFARLGTRHDFEAFVSRAPGTLFTLGEDGSTRNTFLLRLADNGPAEHVRTYTFALEGLPGAELVAPPVSLRATEATQVPLVVVAPPGASLARTTPIDIHIVARDPTGQTDALRVGTTFKSAAAGPES